MIDMGKAPALVQTARLILPIGGGSDFGFWARVQTGYAQHGITLKPVNSVLEQYYRMRQNAAGSR
jgi:hypothetical protein